MMAAAGGNSDRGWNDPPIFMCEAGLGSDVSTSGLDVPLKSKCQLTKRVAYPSMVAKSKEETTCDSNRKTNVIHPAFGSSPPRTHPFLKANLPPRASNETPITCPIPPHQDTDDENTNKFKLSLDTNSDIMSIEKRKKVIEILYQLVEDLRIKNCMSEKQLSDISKKIELLDQQWLSVTGAEGNMNGEIKEKLVRISLAVEEKKWENAKKLQVALAVDHPGLVNKWIMALKKLLMEAEKIWPVSPVNEKSVENMNNCETPFFVPTM